MKTGEQPLPDDLAKAVEDAKKAIHCLYVAVDQSVAKQVEDAMKPVFTAAKRSQDLAQRVRELEEQCDHDKVYYSTEHGNYYCGKCHKGMGNAYAELGHKHHVLEQLSREKDKLIERLYACLKAMDADLKENMPEYERIEGVTEALSLAHLKGYGKTK